jgi:ABC-type amino acid transport substrate-binding protein
MRLYFFIFLLTAVSLTAVYGQNSEEGDSWTKIMNSGEGIMAVLYASEPGIIYKDKDGEIKGVCADILADFVDFVNKNYGKKITVKFLRNETDFPRFLSIVQNTNNLLGVSNTTITEARRKVLKFTPAYLKNISVLLTNQNVPTIKSLDQLNTTHKDLTAEILKGSSHEQSIEKIKKEVAPNLKINYVTSSQTIFKDLAVNEKIFTIFDVTAYVGMMNEKKKFPIKRQEVNLKIVDEIGFIMSKQSDWDKPWQEFLTPDYLKSIRYKQIISKHLGASFFALTK